MRFITTAALLCAVALSSTPIDAFTLSSSTQCTYTLGYWKQHYPAAWPASIIDEGLVLGDITYTAAQLEAILHESPSQGPCTGAPNGGNGLITLAHQLITSYINYINLGYTQAQINVQFPTIFSAFNAFKVCIL